MSNAMPIPPTVTPSRHRIIGVVIVLLALFAALLLAIVVRQRVAKTSPSSSMSTPQQKVAVPSLRLVPALATSNGKTILTISLRPEKDTVPLSAFSVQLLVTGSKGAGLTAGKLVPSPDAVSAGWTFPLATTTQQSPGSVAIKVSGVFINNTLFSMSKDISIASVSLESPRASSLSLKLDGKVTEFFGENGQRVPVTLDRETITLEKGAP